VDGRHANQPSSDGRGGSVQSSFSPAVSSQHEISMPSRRLHGGKTWCIAQQLQQLQFNARRERERERAEKGLFVFLIIPLHSLGLHSLHSLGLGAPKPPLRASSSHLARSGRHRETAHAKILCTEPPHDPWLTLLTVRYLAKY
jgi:hypothetical protein